MVATAPIVGTIADLRKIYPGAAGIPTDATTVIVERFWPGIAGGGGAFSWAAADEPDNNGTVILPIPGPPSGKGCWKRLENHPVDVRWFGAKGDGVTDDTEAIQAAIDAVISPNAGPFTTPESGHGNSVVLPPGNYRITAAPNTPAIVIKHNVRLERSGGAPNGASVLLISGGGDGILIEGSFAAYSVLRNVQLRMATSADSGTNGIVVHSPNVSIESCGITGMRQYGVLVESGTAGAGTLEGATKLQSGETVNSNAWRLWNIWIDTCGDQSTDDVRKGGAGVRVHGSDANGGVAVGCIAQNCNIGFSDGSLAGGTFISCYLEAGRLGFLAGSPNGTVLINCFSEPNAGTGLNHVEYDGSGHLIIGGTTSEPLFGDLPFRVMQHNSNLRFRGHDDQGDWYGACLPLPSQRAAIQFAHEAPGLTADHAWNISFDALGKGWPFYKDVFPYMSGSWQIVKSTTSGSPWNSSPLGWTEGDHPRGCGLPFFPNPLLNSHRRWSWRQSGVVLQPGANTIYLNGGALDAGPITFTKKPLLPTADTRVTIPRWKCRRSSW